MTNNTDFATRSASRALCAAAALVVATAFVPWAMAAESAARKSVIANGLEEYTESCASCHGADGKGGGSLAAKLVKPPKDLGAIAAANAGTFPFWRVFSIIAGEAAVEGHDTHQMPDFYTRLKADDAKPGYLPAHIRVLALTHYLESLQK